MLTISTYAYCVTIVWTYHADQSHQRSVKGQQRTEKTRKQCHGCFKWLVSFCVREHSLITEIQLVSLVNHVSSACKIANHASCCNDRSRVTQIIWVQSRVTLQILGPSRVMKKRFATLLTDKLLILKRNGNLSETIYKKIKPRHKEPPGIYGLPKIPHR